MIDYSESAESPIFTMSRRIGTAYLLLALFAGLLGGGMTLPFVMQHPTAGLLVGHTVLMGFFVIVPGILGGLAHWLLPQAIGAQKMALPSFSLVAWLLLAIGIIVLPLWPVSALMLWAVGSAILAVNIIATILEERAKPYRVLSPMVWAFLCNAITVILIAPVLMALLVKGKIDVTSASSLMQFFQIPELSLMILPAFGMVAQALLPQKETLSNNVAPYLFAIIGVVSPLLWVKSLFCDFFFDGSLYILYFTQLVPAIIFLISLCVSLWHASFRQSAAPYWAVLAVILLLIGTVTAFFLPSRYNVLFAVGDIGHGHQCIVFGSLLALCAGFYAWVAQMIPFFSRGYLELGIAHAFVTFAAMLCFMIPQAQLFAIMLSASSIVLFVFMGIYACVTFKKRQKPLLKQTFVKS